MKSSSTLILKNLFIFFLTFSISLSADVKSTKGQIKFDVNADSTAEMNLTSTGLGIGVTPSANLEIMGNAIISDQLIIGNSSSTSNLSLNGTIGHSYETISSNTTLSEQSLAFVDTSNGNITLQLPEASTVEGRIYTIKKTSSENKLFIRSSGFIDSYSEYSLDASYQGSITIVSSSSNWHILSNSGNGELLSNDNLVGWWKLDETSGSTASDSMTNNFDGNTMNIAASNIGIEGVFQNAIDFNGVDNYIEIDDDNALDITGQFSIVALVKMDSNPSGNEEGILCKYRNQTSFTNQRAYALTINTSGQATGYLSTNGSYSDGVSSNSVNSATDVADGQWHHLVLTYIPSTSFTIYVDGQQDGIETTNVMSSINNSVAPLWIGLFFDTTNANRYAKSIIDDVRLYNRALDSDEVQLLYSQSQ